MFGLAEQRAGFAVYGYVRRGQKEGDANFTGGKAKCHDPLSRNPDHPGRGDSTHRR